MRTLTVLVLLTPLAGCKGLLADLLGEEAPCEAYAPFWPDADQDGVGDVGAMYFGCVAPEGYVDVPPGGALDTDASDTDAADTDGGDTDPPDTDPADSDPADTDATDSAPGETDAADTDPADTDPSP